MKAIELWTVIKKEHDGRFIIVAPLGDRAEALFFLNFQDKYDPKELILGKTIHEVTYH